MQVECFCCSASVESPGVIALIVTGLNKVSLGCAPESLAFISMLGGTAKVPRGSGASMPSVSHVSFNFDRASLAVHSAD